MFLRSRSKIRMRIRGGCCLNEGFEGAAGHGSGTKIPWITFVPQKGRHSLEEQHPQQLRLLEDEEMFALETYLLSRKSTMAFPGILFYIYILHIFIPYTRIKGNFPAFLDSGWNSTSNVYSSQCLHRTRAGLKYIVHRI
jgi:hypothetical protein